MSAVIHVRQNCDQRIVVRFNTSLKYSHCAKYSIRCLTSLPIPLFLLKMHTYIYSDVEYWWQSLTLFSIIHSDIHWKRNHFDHESFLLWNKTIKTDTELLKQKSKQALARESKLHAFSFYVFVIQKLAWFIISVTIRHKNSYKQ